MKLWKKYLYMVCMFCLFTAGNILVFTEETHAAENAKSHTQENEDFDIWNGELRRYVGSGGDVVIPEGITVICEGAFYHCTTLTSVVIPGSVKEIMDGAFTGCMGLTELIIGEGIEKIGRSTTGDMDYFIGTFSGCTSLQTVEIPNSVRDLGKNTFGGCSGLKKVKLSGGMSAVKEKVFEGCTSLEQITIPENIRYIYQNAFYGCSALERISFPENLDFIGETAFAGTKWMADRRAENPLVAAGGILISGGAASGCVRIPEDVIRIAETAFRGNKNLVEVVIPGTVKEIGTAAFESCVNLKKLKMEKGIENIGQYAFDSCGCLTEIEIPEGVTFLGYGAFARCSNLKSAKIPGSIYSVGDGGGCSIMGVFEECPVLEYVSISNGTREISSSVFLGCGQLTRVEIPASVEYIAEDAFRECKEVTIWGQEGSFAQTYAAEKRIPFRILGSDRGIVRFDANGGTKPSFDSMEVVENCVYGKLPDVEREGYSFEGWYTAKIGGIWVTEESVVQIPCEPVLYAHWSELPVNWLPVNDRMTVRFDANGGTKPGFDSMEVIENGICGKLPDTVREGYLFEGWYTAASGGTLVTEQTVVTLPWEPVLYAHWSKVSVKRVLLQKPAGLRGKKMKAKWNKVPGADGYQYVYSYHKQFKKAVKKTTLKNTITIKKLKKGKTCYIKVRAYRFDSTGKKIYGKFSNIVRSI